MVYLPIYTWQLLRQYRQIGPTNYVRAYFASLVKFQKIGMQITVTFALLTL